MTGFQAAHFFSPPTPPSAPCFGTRSQLIVKFPGFRWSLEGEVVEEMACRRVQRCWLSCAIRSNPPVSIFFLPSLPLIFVHFHPYMFLQQSAAEQVLVRVDVRVC